MPHCPIALHDGSSCQSSGCGLRAMSRVQAARLHDRADRPGAGPPQANHTSFFFSGRTLEVLSQLLAPPSRDGETDVQGGGAFLELHRLLIDILMFLRTLTARHQAKRSTFITLFICSVIHE